MPGPMENSIASSPLLQGAVMFGRERNQVGIIVEPHAEHAVEVRDNNAVAAFRNKIWYVSRLPFLDTDRQMHILIVIFKAAC